MRILIVSEFFAPVRSIGSIRWTKLAKYLKKNHAIKIDLLTNEKQFSTDHKPSTYFYDEDAVGETASLNQVITLPPSFCVKAINLIFDSIYRMIGSRNPSESRPNSNANDSRLKESARTVYEQVYSFALSSLLTMRTNSIAKSSKRVHLDHAKYDAVISTSPSIWTHKVASEIKRAHRDILWLADYRDPSNNMSDIPKRHKIDTVRTYSRDADIILTVWQNESDIMQIPDGTRIAYIPNGFDPDEASLRERPPLNIFRISYTGSLVSEQDLTPLFVALTDLIERNAIDGSQIEISYAGSTSGAFQSMIKGFESLKYVDHGFLSRKDALALQDSSAMLISCTWNTETYKTGIGGKLFELISSGIPIAGICTGGIPDSPLKRFLSTTNTGFCYEEANDKASMESLEAYISRCYEEWQRTGTTKTNPNAEELERFRHDRLADRIYEIIRSLSSHRMK